MLKLLEGRKIQGRPVMRFMSTKRDNLKSRFITISGNPKFTYYPDCPLRYGDIIKVTFYRGYVDVRVKRKNLKEKLKFRVKLE
jgi:hypothetical protein